MGHVPLIHLVAHHGEIRSQEGEQVLDGEFDDGLIATDNVQAAFEVGLVAGCAYFIFKLVRIWQQTDTVYENVTASLTVFDALSILSLMSCFIGGIVVWSNFGKGLREACE